LQHVDRASTLRKIEARGAKIGSDGESDVSDVEEEEEGEYDSDAIENDDVLMIGTDDGDDPSRELLQQLDFVPLS